MRTPSFLSFLKKYLKHLGQSETLSLTKLVQIASNTHARVVEPLYFYAVDTNQLERLLCLSRGQRFYEVYIQLATDFPDKDALFAGLEAKSPCIPMRFYKVYQSYTTLRDKTDNDREYTRLVYNEVSKQLKQKNLSKYRIYTDLKLNPGNANSFLAHGDASKVSRQTADRILDYVSGY